MSRSDHTPAYGHSRSSRRPRRFHVLYCTVFRSLHLSTRFRLQTRWTLSGIFHHCNNTHPVSLCCHCPSTGSQDHFRSAPSARLQDRFLLRRWSYRPGLPYCLTHSHWWHHSHLPDQSNRCRFPFLLPVCHPRFLRTGYHLHFLHRSCHFRLLHRLHRFPHFLEVYRSHHFRTTPRYYWQNMNHSHLFQKKHLKN